MFRIQFPAGKTAQAKFGGTDSHFRALNNASELLLDPDRTQILAAEFCTTIAAGLMRDLERVNRGES